MAASGDAEAPRAVVAEALRLPALLDRFKPRFMYRIRALPKEVLLPRSLPESRRLEYHDLKHAALSERL
jgi:hypothetical protein